MRPPFRRKLLDETTGVADSVDRPSAAPIEVGVGDEWVRDVIVRVQPFTMTSHQRIYGLCKAVEYVCDHSIPGDFVECGVWRGGSAMAIALTLQGLGVSGREIVLFDTFAGMTAPGDMDRDLAGHGAGELLAEGDPATSPVWATASLSEVKDNLADVGYPLLRYVEGDVTATLPDFAPDTIALLRLDTDWYESTLHELVHLYPRISTGGVLIVDDYGHWAGARRAVDEYLASQPNPPFLCPLDYTGRLAVVP